MKINLFKLFLLKEIVYWSRMANSFNDFNGVINKILFGSLLTIIISVFHYIFAFPHFIFECIMWLFYRGQFRLNMKNLYHKSLKELVKIKNK